MLGSYLRQSRQKVDLSLGEVADKTNIRRYYLEALECEEYEKMPDEFYVKGYLKIYLKELRMDPATALNFYCTDTGNSPYDGCQKDGAKRVIENSLSGDVGAGKAGQSTDLKSKEKGG